MWTIVGFMLVLLGSYLVTRKRQEQVAAEGVEEACAEQGATLTENSGAVSIARDPVRRPE